VGGHGSGALLLGGSRCLAVPTGLAREQRTDLLPGGTFPILIVLMSSALVIAIWGVARERLVTIVSTALSSVCGSVGC
jgi:hypothetical protein